MFGNTMEPRKNIKTKAKEVVGNSTVLKILFHDLFFKMGMGILIFFTAVALIAFVYIPYNPVATSGPLWSPPSLAHLFGTTSTGQDVFSQWMYGSQPTLMVAILSALIAAVFGVLMGLTAGFFRRADEPLMRVADFFLILPVLPLLIVISVFIKPTNYTAALIIGIFSWPWMARTVRSVAVSLRKSAFMEVATMSGLPKKFMIKDIFMHSLPLVIANSVFAATGGILFLAYMDYLGVGPITSYAWGTTLFFAQTSNAIYVGAWWWIIPPGLSIGILAMGFSMVGYSLENAYRGAT